MVKSSCCRDGQFCVEKVHISVEITNFLIIVTCYKKGTIQDNYHVHSHVIVDGSADNLTPLLL